MTVIPINGYVLLQEEAHEKETASGIVLPDDPDLEPTHRAIVVACPDGLPFKAGDRVLIKRYMFDVIDVDGEQRLLGKADGVCAVLYA